MLSPTEAESHHGWVTIRPGARAEFPDVRLNMLDGEPVPLSSLRRRMVVMETGSYS